MTDHAALHASVDRLRELVTPLDGDQLRAQSYASEWTVADVLSHIGSGAVIARESIDASVDGRKLPDDFAPPIWDGWNAKSPEAKAADALLADRALLERIETVSDADRARLMFSMGPMELPFEAYIGLRVNEHILHTWDVEVAFDPTAVLPADEAAIVVDQLEMITRFAAQSSGPQREVRIHTTAPERRFTLSLGDDGSSLTPGDAAGAADLELPAEAFIRLVYGRLDPAHTPTVSGDADLDELRAAFPGL
jgi:uncharacterized protein (TIGR03083 family)